MNARRQCLYRNRNLKIGWRCSISNASPSPKSLFHLFILSCGWNLVIFLLKRRLSRSPLSYANEGVHFKVDRTRRPADKSRSQTVSLVIRNCLYRSIYILFFQKPFCPYYFFFFLVSGLDNSAPRTNLALEIKIIPFFQTSHLVFTASSWPRNSYLKKT